MTNKHNNKTEKKNFFRFTIGPVTVSLLIFVLILVSVFEIGPRLSALNNRKLLSNAAKDITLPENFELYQTDFQNGNCLDTCAYMLLHYRSRDGKPLDREVVNQKVEQLGYTMAEYDKYYGNTRRYGRNGLTTEQLNAPPEQLTLMISK